MKNLLLLTIFMTILTFGIVIAADSLSIERIDDIRNKTYIDGIRDTDSIRVPDGGILIWKDYKSYYSDEKRILIEDSGFNVQLDVRLLTKYHQRVKTSNDTKVASLSLTDWKDGRSDLIDSIELYNIKDGYTKEDKDLWFKYKDITLKEYCYDTNESNFTKEKNVSMECYDYNTTEWILFDSLNDLPNKNIEIGIFTETNLGDNYEWVITLEGFEILEWASFLADNAVASYRMELTSGDVEDGVAGTFNGTANSVTRGVTGKIDNAFDFNGATNTDVDGIPQMFANAATRTQIAWVNHDSGASGSELITAVYRSDDSFQWGINSDDTLFLEQRIGGSWSKFSSTAAVTDDAWVFVAVTWDLSTRNRTLYINGVRDSSNIAPGGTIAASNFDTFSIGSLTNQQWFDGEIDELTIFSDVKNDSEILLYYNDDDGLPYPFDLAPSDTCTYSSGNWDILFNDNCTITSNVDVGGNNISITGNGTFLTTANITGYSLLHISGDGDPEIAVATCRDGGCFHE